MSAPEEPHDGMVLFGKQRPDGSMEWSVLGPPGSFEIKPAADAAKDDAAVFPLKLPPVEFSCTFEVDAEGVEAFAGFARRLDIMDSLDAMFPDDARLPEFRDGP